MTDSLPSSKNLLLVPSAIIVPDELRLDVGSIPTGMVPLRGKPMLERIAEEYEDYNVTPVVAVHKDAESIVNYTKRSKYNWKTVDVGATDTLGETIVEALDTFHREDLIDRRLYLNFADTLVSPIRDVKTDEYISYKMESRGYRWTTFEIKNGKIGKVTEKYQDQGTGAQPAFVGQFGISDCFQFLSELKEMVNDSPERNPIFYDAILSYLENREYLLYEPEMWLDVGHLDTYHRGKKQFLNAREFNEIQISDKNVITKTSEDISTLINEIEWYTQMPTELQPYLPRLYNWSTKDQNPFVELEYVGYPSLADLQLYGSHGPHIWNSIFHSLFEMLQEFREFATDSTNGDIQSSLRAMYIKKTRSRLDQLSKDDQFTQYFQKRTTVNSTEYPPLNEIVKKLESMVSDAGLLQSASFSVIHGDLCLPNILYDPRNEILKLIDPRGEFGEFTIYGDYTYDLAKLRHSLVGHYEHLINGQFEVVNQGTDIRYRIETTKAQKEREQRFDTLLNTRSNASIREVKLIEALLFLSMVPLHNDSYERQLCMLAQGFEKISPYL